MERNENRTFLMIYFKGEEMPMAIKVLPTPQQPDWAEDRLGANLSVSYLGDGTIRFRFVTGLFAMNPGSRRTFWIYATVSEDRYGQDHVVFDLPIDSIEQYGVQVHDQTGRFIAECRTYWENKYGCRYKRSYEPGDDEHINVPGYGFTPYVRDAHKEEQEKMFGKMAEMLIENNRLMHEFISELAEKLEQ